MSKKNLADLSVEERAAYAARVKSLRQGAGMTQAEVATAAGVSRATVNTLESGSTTPQADVLAKVLRVLGVDIEETRFEEQTEMWLTMIGTLIEAIPEQRRSQTVDSALRVLGDGVRGSNVTQLRAAVSSPIETELPYAAHRVDGGAEGIRAEQEGEAD